MLNSEKYIGRHGLFDQLDLNISVLVYVIFSYLEKKISCEGFLLEFCWLNLTVSICRS